MQTSNFDLTLKNKVNRPGVQHYFGHGKLLLTGEYVVLDGATSIALPTKAGQSLSVRYEKSYDPKLFWVSKDLNGNTWFEATFEFWNFDFKGMAPNPDVLYLQRILREIRKQNTHFLREDVNVLGIHLVKLCLEIPNLKQRLLFKNLVYNL